MRIATVSAVLDEPEKVQKELNEVIAENKHIIKGRMGIPMSEYGVSIIALAVIGQTDEINAFTGRLGKLSNVQVKTSFSKKEI